MEHLAETMTDFLLRRKYITEEQTEWCHYGKGLVIRRLRVSSYVHGPLG